MSASRQPIYILDNNIRVRLADSNDLDYATAQNAVKILRSAGVELRTVPQTLFEFWVVATRPGNRNGLGMSIEDAESVLSRLIGLFPPLTDSPATVTY